MNCVPPLSLIINPLEEFFVDHPEYRKGILDMVKQNADYLLELINQLLDFRKLDAKAETLKCKHDNILIIPERDISFLRPDSTETEHRLQLYQSAAFRIHGFRL